MTVVVEAAEGLAKCHSETWLSQQQPQRACGVVQLHKATFCNISKATTIPFPGCSWFLFTWMSESEPLTDDFGAI